MITIEGKSFDSERALYGYSDAVIRNCAFAGEADGESALKCSHNIEVYDTQCALRYPFWHDDNLILDGCTMTSDCRAALWYSSNVRISNSTLHGIKALRECRAVTLRGCSVISPEFGWFSSGINIAHTDVAGDYFMLRSSDLTLDGLTLNGKYSLQYIENAVITNSTLNTKDALWHAKHVTVRDCTVNGEYLGWYSENVTFINCLLRGTQPLCCCKALRIIDCRMEEADRAFEKSDVEADVIGRIDSVKNAASGTIKCDEVGEVIADDARCHGEVVIASRRPPLAVLD